MSHFQWQQDPGPNALKGKAGPSAFAEGPTSTAPIFLASADMHDTRDQK